MNDLKLCSTIEIESKAIDGTVDIFSKDIGMNFGISKCAKVIVQGGTSEPSECIPPGTGRTTNVETD